MSCNTLALKSCYMREKLAATRFLVFMWKWQSCHYISFTWSSHSWHCRRMNASYGQIRAQVPWKEQFPKGNCGVLHAATPPQVPKYICSAMRFGGVGSCTPCHYISSNYCLLCRFGIKKTKQSGLKKVYSAVQVDLVLLTSKREATLAVKTGHKLWITSRITTRDAGWSQ